MKYIVLFIVFLFIQGCKQKVQTRNFITRYENGQIKTVIYFYQAIEKDEEQLVERSIEIQYFSNGKLKNIIFQRKNIFDGPFLSYDRFGQLISMRTYRDGLLEGPFYEVYKKGVIKKSGSYKKGILKYLFKYDSISKKCRSYSLWNDTDYIAFYMFNKSGLVKRKLFYKNKDGQKYNETFLFYQNNKLMSYRKKSEGNIYASNYESWMNYDSLTGKITDSYRMLDKKLSLTEMKDTLIIEPYVNYRFDNLNNYKIEIINTSNKQNIYSVKNEKNVFKIKKESKMSWIFKICDSHGCTAIPNTYDENAKW